MKNELAISPKNSEKALFIITPPPYFAAKRLFQPKIDAKSGFLLIYAENYNLSVLLIK
jgi:hypothetical protein